MAGKLRRGFKAEAERTSIQVRKRLGLTSTERLDPFELAASYDVQVMPLSGFPALGLSKASYDQLVNQSNRFSAVTICHDASRMTVFNDSHSRERSSNDLTHEIAHIILNHPSQPTFGIGECREWDDSYESEADWLAGALLVPRDGLLALMRGRRTMADGAAHFGVTIDLIRWRWNMSGVKQIVSSMASSRS